MKIQELKWIESPSLGGRRKLIALDCFGNQFRRIDLPAHDVDALRSAAQAEYEACIRSALVEVPAVKGEPEPVAWRDIIKQPDERPLPTYSQIPWAQLGRDVNDATFGRRADFEFSDKVYPGHQMVLGINFNSLARIVDKYRYYGLPCAAKPYAAPPADAWMREALDYAERLAVVLWSKHFKDSAPNWKPLTGDLIGLLTQIDNMTAALVAPGATTESDGGQPIHAIKMPEYHYQELDMSGDHHGVTSNYSEYTPVTVRGSTSDPSSTRSEVTALADIAKERQRQRDIEGWTVAHDDGHDAGEMASAAACYALSATGLRGDDGAMLRFWPWNDHWWKPTNRRRDLIKAGALIVAEIERLDRLDRRK